MGGVASFPHNYFGDPIPVIEYKKRPAIKFFYLCDSFVKVRSASSCDFSFLKSNVRFWGECDVRYQTLAQRLVLSGTINMGDGDDIFTGSSQEILTVDLGNGNDSFISSAHNGAFGDLITGGAGDDSFAFIDGWASAV